MDSMTSLSAGRGPISAVHTVREDEIRSDRASHPCLPFAEEAAAGEGSREGTASIADIPDIPDIPDHVRIHSRLQALRAIRTLRAGQAEKEREKGEISHVFS